jgi:hypothetical protein
LLLYFTIHTHKVLNISMFNLLERKLPVIETNGLIS